MERGQGNEMMIKWENSCTLCFLKTLKQLKPRLPGNWPLWRNLQEPPGEANFDTLQQVYTGAVRPVVEYTSTTWDSASKTNRSKLDRVQNIGLRTILGVLRSTPIQQMEKTADLQPLECRREYKAATQGGKTETDQSSIQPETSAWSNQKKKKKKKTPEKKEHQAQVEGSAKRKCWSSGGRSRKVWGTLNECLGEIVL